MTNEEQELQELTEFYKKYENLYTQIKGDFFKLCGNLDMQLYKLEQIANSKQDPSEALQQVKILLARTRDLFAASHVETTYTPDTEEFETVSPKMSYYNEVIKYEEKVRKEPNTENIF